MKVSVIYGIENHGKLGVARGSFYYIVRRMVGAVIHVCRMHLENYVYCYTDICMRRSQRHAADAVDGVSRNVCARAPMGGCPPQMVV